MNITAILLAPFVAAAIFVLVVFVLLLIWAACSSLECLLWWAGWSKRPGRDPIAEQPASAQHIPEAESYIVYLCGAGVIDPMQMDDKEVYFLDLLKERLPRSTVVYDVFPYSATNNALTGDRRTKRLWSYALRARESWHRSAIQRLSIHLQQFTNVLQVFVSADRRYGPIFSYGLAREVVASLLQSGYPVGSQKPVIMLALSGGGQLSVGCVPILKRLLQRPIWLISVGSVLGDDPGILELEHVYHLSGSKDNIQNLGQIIRPGCWPIFPHSAPNQARRQGKITVLDAGPMKHLKRGDYQSRSARLPDGRRYVDKTLDTVTDLIHGIETKVNPQGTLRDASLEGASGIC